MYIKQFPQAWKEPEIEDFITKNFGIYGTISSMGVFDDKNIQKFYAFVAFEEQEFAQTALVELQDHAFEGHEEKLYIAYAQDKATRRRTLKTKHMKFKNETNLYIKSLKGDVLDKQISTAFEKYGKVTSVCIKTHEPKNTPGIVPSSEKPAVKLKFGFVNFSSAEEAKTAFTECKKDPNVLCLLDQSLLSRGGEFVYYAQSKTVRQQYLRMQKKNLKTFKIIQDNVLQYYQLMKYFMPQNFRQNNRGNNRGGPNNRGNRGTGFRSRGGQNQGRGFSSGQRDNNRDHHSQSGNTPTPGPNQHGNTPAPNMMFNNTDLQQFAQMQGMSGLPMNFQQQMMGQGGMPSLMMGQPPQSGAPQQMVPGMGGQPQMPMLTPQAAQNRDCAWLKNNISEFENMDNHEKKNILGNLMYPLVEKSVSNPEHVPKITGMLIDLEVLKVIEIVEIMENQDALKDRIDEAIGIINETE